MLDLGVPHILSSVRTSILNNRSLIGKDSDAGRDWGQEEKETTEDEMAGWHHWLDGHESQWTPGVGDRQGGLACCDSWGCKESDPTWATDLIWFLTFKQNNYWITDNSHLNFNICCPFASTKAEAIYIYTKRDIFIAISLTYLSKGRNWF